MKTGKKVSEVNVIDMDSQRPPDNETTLAYRHWLSLIWHFGLTSGNTNPSHVESREKV